VGGSTIPTGRARASVGSIKGDHPGAYTATTMASEMFLDVDPQTLIPLALPEQRRQSCDVADDSARLVLREHLRLQGFGITLFSCFAPLGIYVGRLGNLRRPAPAGWRPARRSGRGWAQPARDEGNRVKPSAVTCGCSVFLSRFSCSSLKALST
jgi:hypothetical protein